MIRQLSKLAVLVAFSSLASSAFAAACDTTITSNDAMQYNTKSIVVPKTCKNFTINLKHVGKLPKTAMGHNVVITKTADVAAVSKEGIAAGAANNYVKASDPRVVAATKLIGGGESTSVTFPVSKLAAGQAYTFFCSFPGHQSMMKGTVAVK